MYEACLEAIAACEIALCPENEIGAVFDTYAGTCDNSVIQKHRLSTIRYRVWAQPFRKTGCLGPCFITAIKNL